LQHAYLREDIEVVELVGLFLLAEGVAGGRFRDILPPGVLIEYLGSVIASVGAQHAQ
jgi:hypothetical protein